MSCEVHYDAASRTWFGPRGKDFYGPEMTLGEVIMRVLQINADQVMQHCDPTGEELTGGQLAQQSARMAQAFKRLGLYRGDVIGISASNTTKLTSVVIAALLRGIPINPLHPEFTEETVKYMYDITEPKLIFCDVENYPTIWAVNQRLVTPATIYLVNGQLEGVRDVGELLNEIESIAAAAYVPCPKLHGDHTAFIVCSSGTTGMPKGVTRSHRSLLCNCKNPNTYTRDSILLSFSPLYWISGTIILLASLLNGCRRIITHRPYSVQYLLQLVATHRVTFLFLASHQIALLSKHDGDFDKLKAQLESIRVLIGAGSKVCKAVSRRMYELIGNQRFIVGYGLSEMGGLSKNLGGPLGSEGKVMRNVELRVLDKLKMPLGINEVGIIYARLRYHWEGYYRNPEATARTLSPDGQWFRTGDIGYLDSEGNLYIQTRDTDVFKYNNFQIYPEQIEEFVLRLPGVSETCVFGVPDLVATNLTACAVVRTASREGQSLRAEQIRSIVERHLSGAYHIRGGVYFVESLPKTPNDKLQRRKVLALVQQLGIAAE
ncbi:luciferin 4-monooxygenase [Drosophila guanche]|uniref:Blast:Luciferin 4-monooxygenase n=1 Tax=Drosophila guanche TaxID=7266 RepID=A0A3B0IZS9_DROGU|nr:luciferin 4-monooxygenase [Drosophila guanche]SPP73795.1 blast:Luciferin 4-monooxygenase [Drosophila guanche]